MGGWLKIEVEDPAADAPRKGRKPARAAAGAGTSGTGAPGLTLGPGVLVIALLVLSVAGGAAWWAWRGAAGPGGAAVAPTSALATIDGVPITARDVDVEYVIQKELQLRVYGKVIDESPAAVAGLRRDLLARLIDRWIAVAEAERIGVVVPEEGLDAQIEDLGRGFGVATGVLRDAVVASPLGLAEADFQAWGRRMVMVQQLVQGEQGQAYAVRYGQLKGQAVSQVTEQVVAGVVNAERQPAIQLHIDGQVIAPVREGEPAPEITLPNLAGETVSLSDFRGRPVMVNFWATWCGPCRVEMPLFLNAHDTYDELVVLGVNSQEPPETVQPYVDGMGLRFPIVLDQSGLYSLIYRVDALPTTIFIDREGIVVRAHRGAIPSRPRLKPMLDEILGSTAEGGRMPHGTMALALGLGALGAPSGAR